MIDMNQIVNVILSPKNMKYYELIGYDIESLKQLQKNYKYKKVVPRNTSLNVMCYDLYPDSHAQVHAICDYCGGDILIEYYVYKRQKDKSIIDKDCCHDCVGKKISDTIIEQNKQKIEEVKQEVIERNLEFIDYFVKQTNRRGRSQVSFRCKKHPELGIQTKGYLDFKIKGYGCRQCAFDKLSEERRHDIEFIRSEFEKRDCELISDKYINNLNKLKYVCNKHPDRVQNISYSDFSSGYGCKVCSSENRSGENSHSWNGVTTNLSDIIRRSLIEWKKNSMKECGYVCVLTKKRFTDIHHIYGFDLILKECLHNLNLNYDIYKTKYVDLDENTLHKIKDECIRLHKTYPLGVCLSKTVHKKFHQIFGAGNNTPDQWQEFVSRYNSGEFQEIMCNT